MSSSVVARRPRSPSGDPVGLSDSGSRASARRAVAAVVDPGEGVKLQICWKLILEEVLVLLKGTDLMYKTEETTDSMFRVQASFSLPADSPGVHRETVSVTGKKCFSILKAESEAALSLLQRLAYGHPKIHFMDVSYIRCEELKIRCEEVLGRAGEKHLLLVSSLSDWDSCARQIEETSGALSNECDGTEWKIREDADRFLRAVNTGSHIKLMVLQDEAKAAKTKLWDVRSSMRKYFNKSLVPKSQSDRLEYARMSNTNISMRTILSEMMVSLGWDGPSLGMWCAGEVWGREIGLYPKAPYGAGKSDSIRIESGDKKCELEATESAAREAILYLERLFSIYIVDVNYNQRMEAQSHLAEAESLLEAISSLADEAHFGWEGLLEDLSDCDERCYNTVVDHEPKDRYNQEYNAKWECAEAVAQLYQSCVSDLQQAHKRKTTISTWLKET